MNFKKLLANRGSGKAVVFVRFPWEGVAATLSNLSCFYKLHLLRFLWLCRELGVPAAHRPLRDQVWRVVAQGSPHPRGDRWLGWTSSWKMPVTQPHSQPLPWHGAPALSPRRAPCRAP